MIHSKQLPQLSQELFELSERLCSQELVLSEMNDAILKGGRAAASQVLAKYVQYKTRLRHLVEESERRIQSINDRFHRDCPKCMSYAGPHAHAGIEPFAEIRDRSISLLEEHSKVVEQLMRRYFTWEIETTTDISLLKRLQWEWRIMGSDPRDPRFELAPELILLCEAKLDEQKGRESIEDHGKKPNHGKSEA